MDNQRMARSEALLFAVGGMFAAVALFLPHPAGSNDPGIAGVGLIALSSAAFLYAYPSERLPRWTFSALMFGGTGLISVAMYFWRPGPVANSVALIYVWVLLYAWYWFTKRAAILHTAFAGASFAVVLAAQPGNTAAATQWMVTMGTATVAGILIGWLVHQVEALADTDPLTKLPNRRAWEQMLDREMARARRTRSALSVAIADLDDFKSVNDIGGHQAGDALLRSIAAAWAPVVRTGDLLARYGGDEFAFVILGDAHEATDAVDRVLGSFPGQSCTAGVATWDGRESREDLIHRADVALYRRKHAGRRPDTAPVAQRHLLTPEPLLGRAARSVSDHRREVLGLVALVVAVAATVGVTHAGRLFASGGWATDLVAGLSVLWVPLVVMLVRRRAAEPQAQGDDAGAIKEAVQEILRSGSLRIAFQPIVKMEDGSVVGYEALSRFPDGVSPDRWFARAAQVGLGLDLELAAVRRAVEGLAGLPDPTAYLSVNVSPATLCDPRLLEVVAATEAGRIVVELTEHVPVDDYVDYQMAMHRLNEIGVRLAVDDAGSGYASLRHVIQMKPDIIKIDGSLIRDVHLDPSRRSLLAAFVSFAADLGATLVAECVEAGEEASVLTSWGVECGQGWWFGRPTGLTEVDRERRQHTPASPRSCVLVVDDDPSFRRLVRMSLSDDPTVHVVEADDGCDAVILARRHQPDVVLLDLAMPSIGGLEALPLIRAVAREARIVVLSAMEACEFGDRAEELGAVAYLAKDTDLVRLDEYLAPLLASDPTSPPMTPEMGKSLMIRPELPR